MTGPDPDNLQIKTNDERMYDVLRFIAKASAGALAPAGLSGLANEMFDLLVADPAAKRRDEFLMNMAMRVARLEERGQLSVEALTDNQDVAALLFRATQAAMRSSGGQKLKALKDAAAKGLLSKSASGAASAQVVVGLLDRMTEYHVILLKWENAPKKFYTTAELHDPANKEAHSSRFYGQPVALDPRQLRQPVNIPAQAAVPFFVEEEDQIAFRLAHADLVSMQLLRPKLKVEKYLEDREVKQRITSEITGHEISELGSFVCKYIEEAPS